MAIRPLVADANTVHKEQQGAGPAGTKPAVLCVFQHFLLSASAALGNDAGKATRITLHFGPYLYFSSPN